MQHTIRELNRCTVLQNPQYQQYITELHSIEKFISDLGFLTFGRDYILCTDRLITLQSIITSVELTVGSIISCCECACIADAHTLLRKYRDDLFFYLYVALFSEEEKGCDSKRTAVMEQNIIRWLDGKLSDLRIQEVLKAIGTSKQLKEAVNKYSLHKSFNQIGDRLNNFVHGNGMLFYNRNINTYRVGELDRDFQSLVSDMKYITITYLFLLILCSPGFVMAFDYIDAIDCGCTPHQDSIYWVAPFVEKFLKANIDLIDMNCYQFLKDRSVMQFSD